MQLAQRKVASQNECSYFWSLQRRMHLFAHGAFEKALPNPLPIWKKCPKNHWKYILQMTLYLYVVVSVAQMVKLLVILMKKCRFPDGRGFKSTLGHFSWQ